MTVRGAHRLARSVGWPNTTDEERVLRDMLVPLARAHIDVQFDEFDTIDTKAWGLLALDSGAIALLATLHKDLHHFWEVPLVAFALSVVLLILSIRPRDLQDGVDMEWFYDAMSGESSLYASRQMLKSLLECQEVNADVLDGSKRWQFRLGFAAFTVGLLTTPLVAIF